MEQYLLPKKLDFKHLRLCLDNYEATHLYIRDCGSHDRITGKNKAEETLEGKTLDFIRNKSGLYFLIGAKEVFHFPLKDYKNKDTKGFSLAYERVDEEEKIVYIQGLVDPYDQSLPEPRKSTLRHILDKHLVEIDFKGRIDLAFHSWWQEPHWKYWKIVKPKTTM